MLQSFIIVLREGFESLLVAAFFPIEKVWRPPFAGRLLGNRSGTSRERGRSVPALTECRRETSVNGAMVSAGDGGLYGERSFA